ncbi:MAG: hypothetical protein UV58_C0005G0012 [Candidatus Wolfebacteria bacterium GW2011_GWC1_43_10]|uniref:PrgI family protein n=2 Tax=Candidatus Wolfeibacteriota TaxID=1752735 RepID=A0A0G1F7D3_9BACT|nr:MAG: hypothetical protein UV58_C0005G0012 [Candidatus Wolfebacteria bacterium GW2011_GWC1_43_10]KKT23146.1 MAG: hypothetical protein UW08_C0001G0109 [Parcubacteria group bacterium GW2011_GWB1_43_8b]OGM89262.1 MAG: hypothetical protein A2108_00095 [Candidatus Wolfebacteria bacterium GWA1_42_9]
MAQFEVPQFIDVESKIVGPLTLKQFGLIAVPSLASFFLFFVLARFLWVIVAFILVMAGVLFAFIKIGGRPLYLITIYAFQFLWKPKLYLWRRAVVQEEIAIPSPAGGLSAVSAKRNALKSAATGVYGSVTKLWQNLTTTKNPIPKREKAVPKKSISEIKEQYMVFRKVSGEREVAKRVDYR